jgi:hypothetical protein
MLPVGKLTGRQPRTRHGNGKGVDGGGAMPARFNHAKPVSDRHQQAFMLRITATPCVAVMIGWS